MIAAVMSRGRNRSLISESLSDIDIKEPAEIAHKRRGSKSLKATAIGLAALLGRAT